MEDIKHMLVWVIRLVVTAGVILFTYTIVGNVLGTVIFVVGSIILLTVIISSFIGIVIGKSRLLKNSGRFELFQIITYSVAVGLILLNAWGANTVLKEEFGPLSATEKIGLIHNAFSSNENEIIALTKDYPMLVTRHITFRYHPDTEKSVEGMIASLNAIEQLEIAIYGREIKKDKPLEVLIFKNADDYFELNRDVHSLESGHYDSNHKRAMVYKGGVSGMEDDLYVIETFVHEYSHYLLDLFLEQEDLKKYDVPVWFDEGIAELMRNRVVSTTRMPSESNFSLSFLELHTHREWNSSKDKIDNDIYYQAYLAIEYILGKNNSPSILSDLLLYQKDSEDFTKNFNRTTGLELASLHQSISSVEQDLSTAWYKWSIDKDFQEANNLYKEILEKLPFYSRAWNQYALMLEENKNWDKAIAARREHIQLNPTSNSLLNMSSMLVLTDSEEAVTMAVEALEAAEKDPYEHNDFFEQWVEDVSRFHQLLTENKNVEAYDSIMESENLSYQQILLQELSAMKTALEY